MKLGMQVGLSPSHIVLDGNPAPPSQKWHSPPKFSAHICCGQMAGWIKMPLGMEVGLGPGDFVLDEDAAPPLLKRGRSLQFSAHVYCGQTAGWIKIAKRTWREVVQKDCQARSLNRQDAMDRTRWKKLIKIG